MPSDRRRALTVELEPVFAAFEATVAECAQLRESAARAATQLEAEAAERARALVAQARTTAEADRAQAAAAVRAHDATLAIEAEAQADQQADQIHRDAERRRPELVALVVDQVRADLRALVSAAHTGDGRA